MKILSSLVASARASGLFRRLLLAAVAIFGAASARATSIPLHSFNGSDGAYPYAGLVQSSDGNFYGTTERGGASDFGTVFKITSGGSLTALYSFSGSDGNYPRAGLVQGSDGNLYGTTTLGGANGGGTVFKITSAGSLTTLYSFGGADGFYPYGLMQGSDGNFYGTTESGGTGFGTVYKITSGGNLTMLYSFSGSDGAGPHAGLVLGKDGNLYGTTAFGGANGGGTVFKITSSGSLTTLHAFTEGGHANPQGALVQGSDGNFYGTTDDVGSDTGIGTVYKITPGGDFTVIHSFNGLDGGNPQAALLQGTDGNFYGTTYAGGPNASAAGTVFRITPDGNLTTLYSFSGSDGANPACALVQGSDGSFYGTTQQGGAHAAGTVFMLTVYPANTDQCKDGGWMNFLFPHRFKNQGDCIQSANTGK